MFKKILIALDDSGCAQRAARLGLALAKGLGAKVVLTHVVDEPYAPFDTEFNKTELLRQANELMEPWKRQTLEQGLGMYSQLLHSNQPAEGIVLVAEQNGCDLIVMGTHGREGLQRVLLGSVAERVSRLSKVPVLLVRGETGAVETSFKRILAPVDGSPSGKPALEIADHLAQHLQSELRLLSVFTYNPPPTFYEGGTFSYDPTAAKQAFVDESERLLEHLAPTLKAPNRISEVVQADRVRESAVIVQYADQKDCDLIVMGTHGRTGLDYLLLGSVAEGVMHHANVPVLLVRPYQTESAIAPGTVLGTIEPAIP